MHRQEMCFRRESTEPKKTTTEEYEVIDTLSREYDIKELCGLMGVSRSGYYKWKKRGKSSQQRHRERVIAIVEEVHTAHPSHGYRWVHAYIRNNYDVECSASFIYKIFRYLGIKSEPKHKNRPRKRKVKDKYPNLIFTTWETVDRPRQVIVSDMTTFRVWYFYFEVTFYFDVFTKQILSCQVADRRGHRDQYVRGLKEIVSMLKGVYRTYDSAHRPRLCLRIGGL